MQANAQASAAPLTQPEVTLKPTVELPKTFEKMLQGKDLDCVTHAVSNSKNINDDKQPKPNDNFTVPLNLFSTEPFTAFELLEKQAATSELAKFCFARFIFISHYGLQYIVSEWQELEKIIACEPLSSHIRMKYSIANAKKFFEEAAQAPKLKNSARDMLLCIALFESTQIIGDGKTLLQLHTDAMLGCKSSLFLYIDYLYMKAKKIFSENFRIFLIETAATFYLEEARAGMWKAMSRIALARYTGEMACKNNVYIKKDIPQAKTDLLAIAEHFGPACFDLYELHLTDPTHFPGGSLVALKHLEAGVAKRHALSKKELSFAIALAYGFTAPETTTDTLMLLFSDPSISKQLRNKYSLEMTAKMQDDLGIKISYYFSPQHVKEVEKFLGMNPIFFFQRNAMTLQAILSKKTIMNKTPASNPAEVKEVQSAKKKRKKAKTKPKVDLTPKKPVDATVKKPSVDAKEAVATIMPPTTIVVPVKPKISWKEMVAEGKAQAEQRRNAQRENDKARAKQKENERIAAELKENLDKIEKLESNYQARKTETKALAAETNRNLSEEVFQTNLELKKRLAKSTQKIEAIDVRLNAALQKNNSLKQTVQRSLGEVKAFRSDFSTATIKISLATAELQKLLALEEKFSADVGIFCDKLIDNTLKEVRAEKAKEEKLKTEKTSVEKWVSTEYHRHENILQTLQTKTWKEICAIVAKETQALEANPALAKIAETFVPQYQKLLARALLPTAVPQSTESMLADEPMVPDAEQAQSMMQPQQIFYQPPAPAYPQPPQQVQTLLTTNDGIHFCDPKTGQWYTHQAVPQQTYYQAGNQYMYWQPPAAQPYPQQAALGYQQDPVYSQAQLYPQAQGYQQPAQVYYQPNVQPRR